MTRLLYALLFACTLTSVPAQADDAKEAGTVAARAKPKKKPKRGPSVFEVPTEDNLPNEPLLRSEPRSEPLIGLGATVGYYYIGVGLGADLWWNTPHRPLDVGLRYLQSQGEITSKSREGIPVREVLDTQMRAIGLYGRYFLGDALNVTAGLTQASLSGSFGYKATDANVHDTFVDFDSNRLMLELSIGHQWRLPTGHIFAVDWIGFGAPLTDSTSIGEDKLAPDGSKVADRVDFFEHTTVEAHLKKQLKDQVFAYALMLRFGTEF